MKRTIVWIILLLVCLSVNQVTFSFSSDIPLIEPISNLSVTKVNDVEFIPISQPEIIVATDQGVFSTSDRGETWTHLNKGLPTGEVISLHSQMEPFLLLASVKGFGVWKWQPTGKNWVSFNTNLPAKTVVCFCKTEKFLYAGSDKEGLFRVKVGSEKWQDLNFDDKNPFLATLQIRDIFFSDEKKGWLATDKGLVLTENEGELWNLLQSNSIAQSSLCTFFVSKDQKIFLVGTESKGIMSTQDSGKTWKEWRFDGLPPLPYTVRSIEWEADTNQYWLGTEEGVWFSDPDTNSFSSHPTLSAKSIFSITHAEMQGWKSIWIGTEKDGLFLSYSVKPPSKPTELAYTIGKKTVLLTWKESVTGSHPVAGYRIFRKDTDAISYQIFGNSLVTSWTDEKVEWLDTYDYAVQAYDSSTPPVYSVPSDSIRVLVDDNPTVVIVAPLPDYETTEETVLLQGYASDEGSGIQQVTLQLTLPSGIEKNIQLSLKSDGSFEQSIPLEIGDHTVTVQAVDNRSHQSTATRHLIRKEAAKDTTPPVITITKPTDPFVHEANSIQVNGTIIDGEGHLLESRIWVEQEKNRLYYRVLTPSNDGVFSETISLPYGKVSIHIQAIDSFGNQSENQVSGTNTEPDTTPPQFYILSPIQGTETEEEQIRFHGRAWDEASGIQTVRVSLDYLSKRMYDRNLSLNDQGFFDLPLSLMEGENHLTLEVTDKKKNSAKETRIVIRRAKPKTIIIELVIGQITALVNGETMTLAYPPEIQKGRTFVPVRFVSEALGANVLWVAQRKEIQITWKEKFISLWLHKTIVTVESLANPDQVPKTLFLETPPYLAKGVTMVPLRLIAEQFGITPQWNPDTQTITLVLIP